LSFNDCEIQDSVDAGLSANIVVPSEGMSIVVVRLRYAKLSQARHVCSDQIYGRKWYTVLLVEVCDATGKYITEQRVEACYWQSSALYFAKGVRMSSRTGGRVGTEPHCP
jgi:hypothetical protein